MERRGRRRSLRALRVEHGGLRVVFRPGSGSDGSPVVEIYAGNLAGNHPAYQKIHFTKGTP